MDLANYLVPVNADLDAISVEENDLHVTSTGRSRGLAPLRSLSIHLYIIYALNTGRAASTSWVLASSVGASRKETYTCLQRSHRNLSSVR